MLKTAKLGAVDMTEVEELTHKTPLSHITTDQDLIANLPQWMFPRYIDADQQWDMVWRSWILVVNSKVIVVDPCTGNGRSFPHFLPANMLDTPFIERFESSGIKPEDVDYVFCTHLHMDHCGWNTVLRNGRYVPTFPNARYVMVQREFDRWDPRRPDHKHVPANEGTFVNSVLPVVEAGLAQIVPDTFNILPGLTVEPAYGHTAGHSMLHLETEGREAYFVGDAFHHPIEFLHPDIDNSTSEIIEQTVPTRRRILDTCIAKNALVIPAHFACPFGGTLRREQGQLIFDAYGDGPAVVQTAGSAAHAHE